MLGKEHSKNRIRTAFRRGRSGALEAEELWAEAQTAEERDRPLDVNSSEHHEVCRGEIGAYDFIW